MIVTDTDAVRFFYEHAGYSWDRKTGTEEEGHRSSAQALADAEARARGVGITFEWTIDYDTDSSDWSDERPSWQTWQCVAWLDENIWGSLGGVDFGRDGEPWGEPYKRVVEAQVALEALATNCGFGVAHEPHHYTGEKWCDGTERATDG